MRFHSVLYLKHNWTALIWHSYKHHNKTYKQTSSKRKELTINDANYQNQSTFSIQQKCCWWNCLYVCVTSVSLVCVMVTSKTTTWTQLTVPTNILTMQFDHNSSIKTNNCCKHTVISLIWLQNLQKQPIACKKSNWFTLTTNIFHVKKCPQIPLTKNKQKTSQIVSWRSWQ